MDGDDIVVDDGRKIRRVDKADKIVMRPSNEYFEKYLWDPTDNNLKIISKKRRRRSKKWDDMIKCIL